MPTRQTILAMTVALITPLAAQAQPALTKPEAVGMNPQKLALISDALKVNIGVGQIPGGVVLVMKDGKVVHLEAQGVTDAVTKTPLKPDTIFNIASLSKPVTAVAVLMLVDEGKIGLDDPISKYIPEFAGERKVRVLKPGSPPAPFTPLPGMQPVSAEWGEAQYDIVTADKPITVRHLLTHTSGTQIFGINNDFPGAADGADLATRVPKLARAPLEFQPGSRWAYSNGPGFEILGRIVEVASGLPLNQFFKQRLFGPLGMKDTDFGVHADAVSRALPPPPGGRVNTSDTITYFNGAAGLSSTVIDYSHFVQMLVDGGEYGGKRFLKAETVKQMASNQIGPLVMGGYPPMALPPEGVKFGLGVLTVSNPTAAGTHVPVGSFGWDGIGTRRWWAIQPDHITIVSMVPLTGPAAAPLQRDIEAAVMSSIGK